MFLSSVFTTLIVWCRGAKNKAMETRFITECWLIRNNHDKQQLILQNSVTHLMKMEVFLHHTHLLVPKKFKGQDLMGPVFKGLSSFLLADLYKWWTATRSGKWRTGGDGCRLEGVMSSTWAWHSEMFRLVRSPNQPERYHSDRSHLISVISDLCMNHRVGVSSQNETLCVLHTPRELIISRLHDHNRYLLTPSLTENPWKQHCLSDTPF